MLSATSLVGNNIIKPEFGINFHDLKKWDEE